jgi:hypothetical protein
MISPEERDDLIWSVAQRLIQKGPFDEVRTVDAPTSDLPLERVFEGMDSTSNRLVVLDPRRWTLLNGKDSTSRADITAVLGLGEHALRVDNAASCVVVAVNTQQRDVARKRSGEVLAWRYVLRQIGDEAEDERADARAKLDEAEGKLGRDIERAYRHYAYLVRAGDLHVQFDRFDDDARTALKGDHVWAQLVHDGRATVPAGLAADYVATLLDQFDRALTPKEIVQGFYKNPAFPLVPSTDEVRRALFDLLRQGWEFVDADGSPLTVVSPGQISINSISQTLRRRTSAPTGTKGAATLTPAATGVEQPSSGGVGEQWGLFGAGDDDQYRAGPASTPATGGPVSYKRYQVTVSNRSITSPEVRDQVWQLLKELAKIIDPAGEADHQLLSLHLTLTTAAGHQGGIEDKAKLLGAQMSVEDDDF